MLSPAPHANANVHANGHTLILALAHLHTCTCTCTRTRTHARTRIRIWTRTTSREQDVQYQMKRGDKRAWDGYITPETLAAWMRHDNKTGYAVVDVRDSDFATKRTGKQMVKGAVSISAREIRNNPSAVVERLQHNDTVVFHCMYSRQRGPGSAQIYAHERHRRHGAVGEDNPQHQNVFVLEGGFKRFYKTFGNSPDNADLFQPAHR